jgi:hypothetical protein
MQKKKLEFLIEQLEERIAPGVIHSNSGRGNGSEGDPDVDPGNSGGHNNGGD